MPYRIGQDGTIYRTNDPRPDDPHPLSIVENLVESFRFAKDGLSGHWGRWLMLSVISCIPLVNAIILGYLVKIFKGSAVAPEVEGCGTMFVDGFKLLFICFFYGVLFLLFLSLLYGIFGEDTLVDLICWVLFVIFTLIFTTGIIRFAKTGKMWEGFNFRAIIAKIGDIGWKHYIFSISAIFFVIFILFLLLVAVIVQEELLGQIIVLLAVPPLILWIGKFLENLYSCA